MIQTENYLMILILIITATITHLHYYIINDNYEYDSKWAKMVCIGIKYNEKFIYNFKFI